MRTLILVLFFFQSLSYAQKIEIGKIDNAPYKIIIPENWNKGLVMYVRGAGGGGPMESFDENKN
ncbi:MAG: alpha/beta hydrolase, partial [Bacteroidota bacterium]|nr:alpha/beta hydrolase [Bacteroidota bacterium]